MVESFEKAEIQDAKWLAEQDELDPKLKRLYSTKGRVGKVTGLQRDGESLRWVGETKEKNLPKWLSVAWMQICQVAKKQVKLPILILHVPGFGEPLHVISRSEHAELMEALKRREELEWEVTDLLAKNHELKERLSAVIPKGLDKPLGEGCWYCGKKGGHDDYVFSVEFDTPVHLSCIQYRLVEEPEDPEARVFAREFGIASINRITPYTGKLEV